MKGRRIDHPYDFTIEDLVNAGVLCKIGHEKLSIGCLMEECEQLFENGGESDVND